jgi:hypothetical protein
MKMNEAMRNVGKKGEQGPNHQGRTDGEADPSAEHCPLIFFSSTWGGVGAFVSSICLTPLSQEAANLPSPICFDAERRQ